jgi:predicted SprT family Zn-dependent metalloprotease
VSSALLARESRRIAEMLRDWPPEAVERVVDEAFALWRVPEMRAEFRWAWNPRLRTTAGRAFLRERRVELNPVLLARHPEVVRAVVIHEFAHLVAHRLRPREPGHGPTWRALMHAAGLPPRASHTLPVADLRRPRRRRTRWIF